MSVFSQESGWSYVSTVEEKAFTIDISSIATLSTIDSAVIYNITDYDNIASVGGTPLVGSSSHSSGVITTPRVDGSTLTHGNQYSLEIVWTDSNGNERLSTVPIICQRR